jgi:hypothetical protein
MRTKALLNTKIKPLALLASFVIILASFAPGSLQQAQHPTPANLELAFRYTKRRKSFAYTTHLKRRGHRQIHSFADLAKEFKFILLNIKIKVARKLDHTWKTTSPPVRCFIHHRKFGIDSQDEDASYALL